MDHYKVLGLEKNASKEEIKRAFRELAMKFHPDKHSQSSKYLKDSATIKFKQISEAYDTLIDDRKRADYNFRTKPTSNSYHHYNTYSNNTNKSRNSYGYGYGNSEYANEYSNSGYARRGSNFSARFAMGLQYITTRSFLLNATSFGLLLGGVFVVNEGGKALWKMQNTGKSFEEAMDSVAKSKAIKDDSS